MGFDPTRAEPNGLAVHRLNHSATSSTIFKLSLYFKTGAFYSSAKVKIDITLIRCRNMSWGDYKVQKVLAMNVMGFVTKSSHTGNRTRAAWVKARNPNH